MRWRYSPILQVIGANADKRCRLTLSRGWRRSQGYGCSPFKKVRELGSDRLGISFSKRFICAVSDFWIVWIPRGNFLFVFYKNKRSMLESFRLIQIKFTFMLLWMWEKDSVGNFPHNKENHPITAALCGDTKMHAQLISEKSLVHTRVAQRATPREGFVKFLCEIHTITPRDYNHVELLKCMFEKKI